MQRDILDWIYDTWVAFAVIWLLSAGFSKKTARSQTLGSRFLQGLLAASGFILMFGWRTQLRPPLRFLHARFLPGAPTFEWAGFVIMLAGFAIAIWARVVLGRNWSATITIKQDHEIVRRGPYAIVRHPIYSGILLAMLGTAIYFGTFQGLVALALTFCGWWLKSRMEEQFMLQQFGQQYREYQQEVKALIPFVL